MKIQRDRAKKRTHDLKWREITKIHGIHPPKDKEENAMRARQAHIGEQGV